LEDRWVDGTIILKSVETRCKGVDWIYLAQDCSQCWAFVNTVMNLQCSIKGGEFIDS
jgi:hypothetical protein